MNPRQLLLDDDGAAVLSYERGEHNHAPWADRVEPLASHAAAVVVAKLGGWRVTGEPDFAAELLGAGAIPDRHAHAMYRDLRADPPPPPGWAHAGLAGVRFEPGLDCPSDALWALHEEAFGPEHPDRRNDQRPLSQRRALLEDLLAGKFFGPPTVGSACALTPDGSLVGVIAMFERVDAGRRLTWIGTVFRASDPQWRGLGATLVQRALVAVAGAGHDQMGLAVTEGNPARSLYERLGFVVTESKVSVRIPGEARV